MASLTFPGWAKWPRDLILQWGSAAKAGSGLTHATFPIAFRVRFTSEREMIDALPLVPTRFVVVDVTGAYETASYPPIVRWTGFLNRLGF